MCNNVNFLAYSNSIALASIANAIELLIEVSEEYQGLLH